MGCQVGVWDAEERPRLLGAQGKFLPFEALDSWNPESGLNVHFIHLALPGAKTPSSGSHSRESA